MRLPCRNGFGLCRHTAIELIKKYDANGDGELSFEEEGKAVADGAAAAYGIEDPAYTWVPSRRYMGIFHEVRPADQALRCLDCHGHSGRLDWQALGYEADPLAACIDSP